MQVVRLDAEGFARSAGEFLASREAEHNLLLGLSGRLLRNSHVYGTSDPYFAVVVDGGGLVVTAALRTPPYNLLLAQTEDPAAYVPLAQDAHAVFGGLPGVSGPAAEIGAFVSAWSSLTGDVARLEMSQRIYEATDVVEPEPPGGRMRAAGDADRGLLLEWLDAFMREVMHGQSREDSAGWLARTEADPDGGIVLWEDGAPASLSGFGARTPHGIRIGPVYTPPELRGHGYARALVAALTRQQLSAGRDFCFLFTDLGNPTSNSIYQRIGYRPVTDIEVWTFEPGGEPTAS